MKRTIKYLINLICLSFLVFSIAVSFAIIVRVSSLKRLFEIIWLQAERISIVSITFLIIVNIAIFIMNLFESDKVGTSEAVVNFYGKENWVFLVRTLLVVAVQK